MNELGTIFKELSQIVSQQVIKRLCDSCLGHDFGPYRLQRRRSAVQRKQRQRQDPQNFGEGEFSAGSCLHFVLDDEHIRLHRAAFSQALLTKNRQPFSLNLLITSIF